MDREDRFDVVVVGGGAAGLSATVALGRSRRRVVVVDADAPRNALAAGVHNFLTRDGTPPGQLMAMGRAEVESYGGRVVRGSVQSVRPADDGFEVEVDDGRWLWGRRLILTTGVVDELPDVPGLQERWGRDVLHCPYCHGWEVRDQAIGVLATGPMATHQALLFAQLSNDVVLFAHTAPPEGEQAEQLAARHITVIEGTVASLTVTGDRLTGVRLSDGSAVARDALVVGPRVQVREGLLADLGLAAVEHPSGGGTHIPAIDPTGRTSVPGVWVAGNVAEPMAQVMGSAAAGLMAGAAVNADLIMEDTAASVAAYAAPVS